MQRGKKIEIFNVKKSESLNKRNELQIRFLHYRKHFFKALLIVIFNVFLKSTIYSYYLISNFIQFCTVLI